MSNSEETENNKLAEEFQLALLVELDHRNAPYLNCSAINMGNVNIDIHIQYDDEGLRFFRYWGIGQLRRKIHEEGFEKVIAAFVEGYIGHIKSMAEWDNRESTKLLEGGNLTESYRESLERKQRKSKSLIEKLSMVKGGDDAL